MGVPQPQDQVMLLDEPPVEAQVPIGDATHDLPIPKPVARVGGDSPADRPQVPSVSAPSSVTSHGGRGRLLLAVGKRLATLAIALVAGLIALLTWQDYVRAPWTRNGSVRVQVANIAPQVSGQIVELRVADNQFVRQGDVLYVIDPFDFQVAVGTSKATVDQEAANLQVKKVESDRRQHLSFLQRHPRSSRPMPATRLRRRPSSMRRNSSLLRPN